MAKGTGKDHEQIYQLCDVIHQGTRAEADKAIDLLKSRGAKVEIEGCDVAVSWEGIRKHVSMVQRKPE